MDTLFSLGQLLVLGGLGYGAWRCFLLAGKYDAESLRADIAASHAARIRGQSETLAHQRMVIDDEEFHFSMLPDNNHDLIGRLNS